MATSAAAAPNPAVKTGLLSSNSGIHTSGVSTVMNSAGVKIPGVSDDTTIAKVQQVQNAPPPAAPPAPPPPQAAPPVVSTTPTDPNATQAGNSAVQKSVIAIAPYSASNSTLIGQDASKVHVDPAALSAALAYYSGILFANNWWVKRLGNTGTMINFDANGNITVGANVADTATFQLGALGTGSTSMPTLGFLLRMMAYQGNLGQAGQFSFTGVSKLTLPTFQVQQEDATQASYAFVPSTIGAMLDTEAQTGTIASSGEPLVVATTSTLSQVANDKIATPVAYTAGTPIFSLTGNNASILILPIYVTAQRTKAMLKAIQAGTINAYYTSLLTEAKSIYANTNSGGAE